MAERPQDVPALRVADLHGSRGRAVEQAEGFLELCGEEELGCPLPMPAPCPTPPPRVARRRWDTRGSPYGAGWMNPAGVPAPPCAGSTGCRLLSPLQITPFALPLLDSGLLGTPRPSLRTPTMPAVPHLLQTQPGGHHAALLMFR